MLYGRFGDTSPTGQAAGEIGRELPKLAGNAKASDGPAIKSRACPVGYQSAFFGWFGQLGIEPGLRTKPVPKMSRTRCDKSLKRV
jgi:hypothetical protein